MSQYLHDRRTVRPDDALCKEKPMRQIIRNPDWIRKFVPDADILAERYADDELAELAERSCAYRRGNSLMRVLLGILLGIVMIGGASSLDRMLLESAPTPTVFLCVWAVVIGLIFSAIMLSIHLSPVYEYESVRAARRLKRMQARQPRRQLSEQEQHEVVYR